jgi:hypothetical protein
MTMLSEFFLAYLNIHLGLMLLKAQFGMLLKPPGWDLALADATEHWWWQSMVCRIFRASLSQHGEVTCKNLCAGAKRFDDDAWEVDLDLARSNPWSNHPHGLQHKLIDGFTL